jgi:drug/metabolite transporter (DMT)-like permease
LTSIRKGLLLSVAAAFCGAASLVFYKAAGHGAGRAEVVLATLSWAALFNTLTALGRRGPALPADRLSLVTAVGLGVLTLLANLAVLQALATLEPALASVVSHTQVLFVAVIAWAVLRERITPRFALGIALALGGIVIMRIPHGPTVRVELAGVGWALVAALMWALMQVISRKVIHRIQPLPVNTLRLWSAALILACLPGTARGLATLDARTCLLAAGAALAGPFLARTLLMYAVRHVPASHSTLMTLVGPVFAFVLGFLAFGSIPSRIEMLGGVLVLAGVAMPLLDLTRPRKASRSH